MSNTTRYGDLEVTTSDDYVATAEIRRPPNNFFDRDLIGHIADAFEALDQDPACRAVVLCAEGKNFCAGANLGGESSGPDDGPHLYDEAVRLFATRTPVVAAIQGAAVGGGFGLALMADFRIGCPESRFTANFARLGFHHGFGLTETLPAIVGQQKALELLYTGRRFKGGEAFELGILDRLVSQDSLRDDARAFALEIARSAPLAVDSIRQTFRGSLPDRIRAATDREKAEQDRLRATDDFKEGVRAMSERRLPDFQGR